MSYAKGRPNRSAAEKAFLICYPPLVLVGYGLYKCHEWFVAWGWAEEVRSFYLFDKHPAFWYASAYTALVCWLAANVVLRGRSPYRRANKARLSGYQKAKFSSIFWSQWVVFYLLPFVLSPLLSGQSLGYDPTRPTRLDAYVYVSKAFTSWGGMAYVFGLVPLSVWFFGKRYCSWFCSCGNLAETVGTTAWGRQWVKFQTPTGPRAKKLESLQTLMFGLGMAYGFLLFFDFLKLFTADSWLAAGKLYQDLAVDLIFGALVGVGAYPFLGTRVWCRFGCPLAKGMEWFGRYVGSRFQVQANANCKGLNLCSQACPMGIDVASFAHQNKTARLGSFGLQQTPCIGCGGCIDICPQEALSFTNKPAR